MIRYMEIFLHKAPMKKLLRCIVRANTKDVALDIINADYPYPLFEEKDIIKHSFISQEKEQKTIEKHESKKTN